MDKADKRYPHRFLNPENRATIRLLPENENGIEGGVLENSNMYLHLPSQFACHALFYAPYVGRFYCDSSYNVSRDNFDYFICIFVDHGSLYVSCNGKNYIANQNDVVILNCKKPHSYYSGGDVSFYFFHFDGASSASFYDLIVTRQGPVIHPQNSVAVLNAMASILALAENGYENEFKISAQIHIILSELISQNSASNGYVSEIITKAIKFIEQHFIENISVEDIAGSVFLSKYHFIRMFKKHTDLTPYAHIVKLRMLYASHLLTNSTNSVELVGEKCGFNSPEHFIRLFRKHMGCSPSRFRKNNQKVTSKLEIL
jgi:AraC-like DNA-binding protein